jgi:hypothetical protein
MGDEPPADDVVELGDRGPRLPGGWPSRLPGWPPSRGAGILAAAALVVGLAAGYAAGDRHALGGAPAGGLKATGPAATASPRSSPAPLPTATFSFADAPALTQDIAACSVQDGAELQLGVRVTNQSTRPLTLQTARAVLPLGMLRQVSWQWATCGALPDGLGRANLALMPGQSTWLAVTFKVQAHCPAPAPVQFSVGYLLQGRPHTASLPGFPDLGQVPYSGCPSPASVAGVQRAVVTESP